MSINSKSFYIGLDNFENENVYKILATGETFSNSAGIWSSGFPKFLPSSKVYLYENNGNVILTTHTADNSLPSLCQIATIKRNSYP